MTSFRFGAVTAVRGDARAWGDAAARLEATGYSALLVPDTLGPRAPRLDDARQRVGEWAWGWTPSPFLALTAAAAATSTLRLATWVLAAPLRTPAATVREARTLVELSGGRFELGLGAGRPGAEQDAETLGVPWGSPRERVDRVEATIAALRGAVGDDLPITLAAAGDRMLRLAGRHAQAVALPLPPTAGTAEVAAFAARVRSATPEGRPPLELSLTIAGVGDDVPQWMRRNAGVSPESLRDAGAVGLLSGDPARDADALVALREATGVSFFTMSVEFAERLVPLVARLSGT